MKKFFDKLMAWFAGRSFASIAVTALLIAILVALNSIIYALTNAFSLYLYAPQKEENPISGNSGRLFENLIDDEDRITVTFLMSRDDLAMHDTGSLVLETAEALDEEHEFLDLRFVNLYTELDQYGNEVDLTKYLTDMKGNETPLRSHSVIFEYNDNYRVITDTATGVGYAGFYTLDSEGYIYSYNGEEIMISMMSWVLHDEHKTAYFTQNHGETADTALTNLLSCAGYYIDLVNLRQQEVPEDAGLLVISSPTSDFERGSDKSVRAEIERIEAYIGRGGDIYVALDPLVKELPVLEGFLAERGFTVSGRSDDNGTYLRDIVKDDVDAITTDGYTFVATHADGYVSGTVHSNIATYGSGRVLMSDVARLILSDGAQALLVSSPTSTTYAGGRQTDGSGSYPVAAFNEFEVENMEGKTSRIFVVAGIYLTSSEAMQTNGYSNKDFMYSVLDVLFDSSCAPYGCRLLTYSSTILENFTMGTARIFATMIMAIPVALGIVGAVIIIRRKNR